MQLSFPGRQEPQKGTDAGIGQRDQTARDREQLYRPEQVPYVLFPPPEADE